jgi:general secretion pathway protein E
MTVLFSAAGSRFAGLDPRDPQFATQTVDRILALGRESGASDIHLQPTAEGLTLELRLDGVLQTVTTFPRELAGNIVSRLKVLADLLTYRTDIPQEGRIREERDPSRAADPALPAALEMRVSTLPTLYGERAVVRLFAAAGRYQWLDDLELPADIAQGLRRALAETSGVILVTGPAGSGKTTTLYACLRQILRDAPARRSLVSLEDPIEAAVPGVAQAQVNAGAGFTIESGLRFLLRQDPEVMLIGEIRDRATAQLAFQAALTGHLLLSSFHAGSAAGAISRLSDMGIEPYLLHSGVRVILGQRLVRRLCKCARESSDAADRLGLEVERAWLPVGCPECAGTGYRGRFLLAELLAPAKSDLGRAILSRSDEARLEELAISAGMVSRWQRARDAVAAGRTSPAEIRRVLGFEQE